MYTLLLITGHYQKILKKEMRITEHSVFQNIYFLQMRMDLQEIARKIKLGYSFGMGVATKQE